MKSVIEVHLLGQTVRIRHEDEAYVRKLEDFINEKVRGLQGQQNVTNLQLAVRLLLVLADEYCVAVREKESVQQKIDSEARRMIDFIEQKADLSRGG